MALTLCCVPLAVPEQFSWCGRVHCPAGGCNWAVAVLGGWYRSKQQPNKCHDTRFPSRTECSTVLSSLGLQ